MAAAIDFADVAQFGGGGVGHPVSLQLHARHLADARVLAELVQDVFGDVRVDVDDRDRLAASRLAADLHRSDVDFALAEHRAYMSNDTGPVDVGVDDHRTFRNHVHGKFID